MKKILIVFLSVILVAAAVLPAAAMKKTVPLSDLKQLGDKQPVCIITAEGPSGPESDDLIELWFDADKNSVSLKKDGKSLKSKDGAYDVPYVSVETNVDGEAVIDVSGQTLIVNDMVMLRITGEAWKIKDNEVEFSDPNAAPVSEPEITSEPETDVTDVPDSEVDATGQNVDNATSEEATTSGEENKTGESKQLDLKLIVIIVEAVLLCVFVVLFILARKSLSDQKAECERLKDKLDSKSNPAGQPNAQTVTRPASPTATGDSQAGRRGMYSGGGISFTTPPAQGTAQPASDGFSGFDAIGTDSAPVTPVAPVAPPPPQKTFMELQKEKLLAAYRDGVTPDGEYRFATMDAKESRMVGKAVIKFVQSESAGHFLVFTDPATKKTYLAPNPRVYSARQRKFSLPTSGFTQCIGLNGNKEDGQVADVTPSELTAYSGDRMTVSRAGYIRWQ